MKKGLLAFLIILIVSFYAFAGTTITSPLWFKFAITRIVPESYVLSFTGTDKGDNISTKKIDTDLDCSTAQAYLKVYTNKVNSYSLKLSFNMMVSDLDSSVKYGYEVQAFDLENEDYKKTVNSDQTSITMVGPNSISASSFITNYYPISFDFNNFLSYYGSGSYTGTITVEVTQS